MARSGLLVDGGLAAAGGILVFLTIWIVVPAPTRALLTLHVGAPELSPFLLVCSAAVFGLAGWRVSQAGGRTAVVAATLAALAAGLAAIPLVRAVRFVPHVDDEMTAAIGKDARPLRRSPVVVSELFTGIETGEARIVRGVAFAAPQGVPLTLDVYRPPAAGRYPVVVQIYGGSWQRGAPGDYPVMATYLAAHGYVVFAIDYRHAPQSRWPAQIDDVRSALTWIRARATDYDADASRIALLGRSAGAHLAMMAAYEPDSPGIAAVVNLYGPVDLTDGYEHPPVPDPIDVRTVEETLLGGPPDRLADLYRSASPLSYVSHRQPPTLLIYGARDTVVLPRFAHALASRLRATGGIAPLIEIPWAGHAFDAVSRGPAGQIALYCVDRFLDWALRAPGGPH